jgi:hypothetical protein
MKSQAKKAIALFSGAAILVLALGFGGGGLLQSRTTTTTTTRPYDSTPASRRPLLPRALSLSENPGDANRYGQSLKTSESIMAARQHPETPDRKPPRNRALQVVPKLAQRAVITHASASIIAGTVGSADLPGQGRAGDQPCDADPTNPCPPPVDVSADSPSRPQPQRPPRTRIICQPAGVFGQFCSSRLVP